LLDECGECNGDGSSCLSVFDNNFPDKFEINNIYPNPFNPTVNIQFSVFKAGTIVTRIVSLDGQLIKNFENAFYSPGIYNLKWSPENVPSGLYFLQIESNSSVGYCNDFPEQTCGVYDLYGPLSFIFIRQALQLHANGKIHPDAAIIQRLTYGRDAIKAHIHHRSAFI